MSIRVRRGLEANRLALIPKMGELIFTIDQKKLYVGDDVTPGGVPVDTGGGGGGAVNSVNSKTGDVVINKSDVGLSNVPNTDFTAAVAANTAKNSYPAGDAAKLAGIAIGATANDTDANLKNRANHTGTQSADTIIDGTTNKAYTATEKTKLAGIATSADVTSATNVGAAMTGASAKTTPVDADTMPLNDSAASNALKKVTWANVKATLKTYFDTLYAAVTHTHVKADVTDFAHTHPLGDLSGITGTPSSATFLRGDGAWQTPAGGGGGDMLAATYDPTSKIADAFSMGNMVETSTKKIMSDTERTKLGGIATGATANSSDAILLNRANHTGTQAESTITNLVTDLAAKAPLASPAFTGTPTGITKSHVGLGNVDNTSDATKQAATLLAAFPVGSIYINTSNTNPGTFLGGTWAAFGAGRMLVGFDSTQVEFDTDEETGGAKTVTLTAAQSGSPAHSHGITDPGHAHGFLGVNGASMGNGSSYPGLSDNTNRNPSTQNATTGISVNNSTATDAAQAHNNLPPYITVRIWKRTA